MIKITHLTGICGIFLFLFLCVQTPVQAQSEAFRHITPRDGLPSGFIRTIVQDSKGFIWIGTNAGLARHDGYSTISFRDNPEDSTSIEGSTVFDFIEYDETTFLIGTDAGFNLFNPATETFNFFTVPDSLPDPGQVQDLLLLNEHQLWMAAGSGLYHIDLRTVDQPAPEVAFFEIPGLEENQIANLTAIATDSLNHIWAGSGTALYKFDLDTEGFVDIGPVSNDAARVLEGAIWDMLYTSENDLLITSANGLARLEDGENEIKEVKQLGAYGRRDLRSASFQSVTEDEDGKIWLGTAYLGAIHWDPATGEIVNYRSEGSNKSRIASDDVHYAFEDDQGNIWFGYHYIGASIMYSDSWKYEVFRPYPDLPLNDPRNTIIDSKMDDEGTLWAITINGLIRDLGTENQEFFLFDFSAFDSIDVTQFLVKIQSIYDDKVHIIASGQGFQSSSIVFDQSKRSNPFRVLQIPDDLSIIPGDGSTRDHIFYAGVYNAHSIIKKDLRSGGIERIDLPVEGEYPDAAFQITAPHFIYENELYVQVYFLGIPGGAEIERFIINLDSGEIRTHELTIDYPIEGLQPPLVSGYEPGIIYLNTATGLIRVDNLNNSYSVMFEDQMSLLREGSMRMVEDEEGYIWLNNLTGLTRLDPLTENVEYFEVARDRYTANMATPTSLPNGEIIFPGNASYIRYNPGDLSSTKPPGETLITSLRAASDVFEVLYNSVEPEIQSDQNTLTFNFVGLDHRNPSSVNYRYRILGAENEQWTQVGTQRSVFIPNLRAGSYTFEVQSGSKFGSFDGQTASLSFSILPPWWNTYPAYLIYFLLFGSIVFGVDRFQRSRLIQRERERAREKELEQAKEIEQAYENLKSAQDQLVQQEKLASLGQLTAGIAHEIKNPLNFVNNFSELSIELIEEARDEIKEINSNFNITNSDLSELLDDIETNLKTINKHGTRADSIVKSMLQHSRGSDGQMEPTALNALLKEYVNLAFHGMRAGKNPINMDMNLELDEEVGEIPVIAEDISRVIVNLCNNAFDAMRDKVEADQTGEEKYIPKLTIRTTSENDNVIIDVEDNGPGIPEELKDRILQPFFTTKKGTQGTGLGLSITNDIIKAHGGELHIESDQNGTLFRISLPQGRENKQ